MPPDHGGTCVFRRRHRLSTDRHGVRVVAGPVAMRDGSRAHHHNTALSHHCSSEQTERVGHFRSQPGGTAATSGSRGSVLKVSGRRDMRSLGCCGVRGGAGGCQARGPGGKGGGVRRRDAPMHAPGRRSRLTIHPSRCSRRQHTTHRGQLSTCSPVPGGSVVTNSLPLPAFLSAAAGATGISWCTQPQATRKQTTPAALLLHPPSHVPRPHPPTHTHSHGRTWSSSTGTCSASAVA